MGENNTFLPGFISITVSPPGMEGNATCNSPAGLCGFSLLVEINRIFCFEDCIFCNDALRYVIP